MTSHVYDPLTGEWRDVNKEKVGDELRANHINLQDEAGVALLAREPEEAVVICVDTSHSMWSYGFEDPWKVSDSDFNRELRAIYDQSISRVDSTG